MLRKSFVVCHRAKGLPTQVRGPWDTPIQIPSRALCMLPGGTDAGCSGRAPVSVSQDAGGAQRLPRGGASAHGTLHSAHVADNHQHSMPENLVPSPTAAGCCSSPAASLMFRGVSVQGGTEDPCLRGQTPKGGHWTRGYSGVGRPKPSALGSTGA